MKIHKNNDLSTAGFGLFDLKQKMFSANRVCFSANSLRNPIPFEIFVENDEKDAENRDFMPKNRVRGRK